MKRVFRAPRDNCFRVYAYVLGIAIAALVPVRRPHLESGSSHAPNLIALEWLSVLIAVLIVLMFASVFLPRVIADETGLTLCHWRRKRVQTIPYAEVQRYVYFTKGRWAFVVGGKVLAPEIDFEDLHPLMLRFARRSLGAKRIRFTQLPPTEDFENLSMLSPKWWPGLVILGLAFGMFLVSAVLFILFSDQLGQVWGVWRFAFARLSVTTEGVRVEWPTSNCALKWDEVQAVLCEGKSPRRSFVLVGKEFSIRIPPHLASELDVMRKVFYSLPETTLYVNFDDSFRKGYRIRGRRRRSWLRNSRGAPAAPELAGAPI